MVLRWGNGHSSIPSVLNVWQAKEDTNLCSKFNNGTVVIILVNYHESFFPNLKQSEESHMMFPSSEKLPLPLPINAVRWKPQIVRAFSNISNYSFFLTIFFKVLATLPFYFKAKLGLLWFGNHRSLCSHYLRALRPCGLWIRMGRKQPSHNNVPGKSDSLDHLVPKEANTDWKP